jgi:hypothetical protein
MALKSAKYMLDQLGSSRFDSTIQHLSLGYAISLYLSHPSRFQLRDIVHNPPSKA